MGITSFFFVGCHLEMGEQMRKTIAMADFLGTNDTEQLQKSDLEFRPEKKSYFHVTYHYFVNIFSGSAVEGISAHAVKII